VLLFQELAQWTRFDVSEGLKVVFGSFFGTPFEMAALAKWAAFESKRVAHSWRPSKGVPKINSYTIGFLYIVLSIGCIK
jgi:hypothetical protein